MMTKREIIKTLLDKKLPERAGLNEHFWPHLIENAWKEQGIEPQTDFVTRFDLDLRGIAWFNLPGPRPDFEATLEETEEWATVRDGWGSITKTWKKKSGTPEHVGFTIDSPEIWKNDFRDAALAIQPDICVNVEELKKKYDEAMQGEEFVTYKSMFVFEWLRKILGDQFMLESLLLEKEFIHDFNSILTDKFIEIYEFVFREVGLPDGVHIFEDLGYTNAAFASPACHREMILPYHKKFFGFLKDHHLPLIVHTCGDFRVHLDSLVETGVDCIQAMEAKTGMNVVEMAKDYKDKLCFMGNLDIREFESGNRERIKAEILTKLDGMKKLKAPYIFMSDHSIPPSVQLADYQYGLELFRKNCFY